MNAELNDTAILRPGLKVDGELALRRARRAKALEIEGAKLTNPEGIAFVVPRCGAPAPEERDPRKYALCDWLYLCTATGDPARTSWQLGSPAWPAMRDRSRASATILNDMPTSW